MNNGSQLRKTQSDYASRHQHSQQHNNHNHNHLSHHGQHHHQMGRPPLTNTVDFSTQAPLGRGGNVNGMNDNKDTFSEEKKLDKQK